jgi:hypothetical protein
MIDISDERGRAYSIGTLVCADCFADYALAACVRVVAESWGDHCDYCGRTGEGIAAPTDMLLELISRSLATEWEELDGSYFDSEDGRYIVPDYDAEELFDQYEPFANDRLAEDVIAAFGDRHFTHFDPMVLDEHDALVFSWSGFADYVRHRGRYLFLVTAREKGTWDEPHAVPPGRMLEELGEVLSQVDLTKTFPASTRLWRARGHPSSQNLDDPSSLGSPPVDATVSTRMAAAGISMFYGAVDEETAVAEVEAHTQQRDGRSVTAAQFVTARDLSVIDLTELPPVPSIFDEERRALRKATRFLHHFASEVSKPLPSLGREDVDYVPTQIVTEFVRDVLRTPEGESYMGIVYRSAARLDGLSCVLFVDANGCCEFEDDWNPIARHWLALDSATIHMQHLDEGPAGVPS